MIRWLREKTVGDPCSEIAHISCAMVAERIFCPLFCRMFSLYSIECFSLLLSVVSLSFVRCFSFLSIGYCSFLVVEGRVRFLFTAHF